MLHYTHTESAKYDKKLLFESSLALLCIPFVALEFMLMPSLITRHEADIKLFVNLGFLGLNHIGCTPSYILSSEENRKWFYRQLSFEAHFANNAVFKMTVLIVLTTIFSYFAQRFGGVSAKKVLAAYIGIWTTVHGLKQHYGIHKLIPQKPKAQDKDLGFFYYSLIYVTIVDVILLNIFSIPSTHWIRWSTCLISWSFVLAIFKIEIKNKNKIRTVYSLRLITWPLNGSFLAAMTERAVHGFTYWNFIKFKMHDTPSPVAPWASMTFFVLFATIFYALGDGLAGAILGFQYDNRWFVAFESLFLGAVIGHAYLDSVLFNSAKRSAPF